MNSLLILENEINLKFKDRQLLSTAFVHRSYINENKKNQLSTNEKLEFLGDSILSLITSVYLFKHHPELDEGSYTDIKASIVRTDSLGLAGRKLKLGNYLKLSKGEEENNGRNNISILADCFEALIAAIYLEFGFEKTDEFINRFLFKDTLENIINDKLYMPTKNKLQEYYQEKYRRLPEYKIISEKGPQHDKTYVIGVFLKGQLIAKGVGKSKKQAQEQAASTALSKLKL